MPNVLTDAQIEQFREEGFVHPIDGISPERCAELVRACERFEAQHQISAGYFKLKGLCCFQEAWDLMEGFTHT